MISGVAFLNTIQPLSHAIAGPAGKYDAQAKKLVPTQSSAVHAHPDLYRERGVSLRGPGRRRHHLRHAQQLQRQLLQSGTSYTGSGVTIGIGGDSAIQASTVADFRTRFLNGDTARPTIIDVGAPANPAQVNSRPG